MNTMTDHAGSHLICANLPNLVKIHASVKTARGALQTQEPSMEE